MTDTQKPLTLAALALAAHIKSRKNTARGWAIANGFNPRSVQKWVRGEALPRADVLVRIANAAEGEVPPALWGAVAPRG